MRGIDVKFLTTEGYEFWLAHGRGMWYVEGWVRFHSLHGVATGVGLVRLHSYPPPCSGCAILHLTTGVPYGYFTVIKPEDVFDRAFTRQAAAEFVGPIQPPAEGWEECVDFVEMGGAG